MHVCCPGLRCCPHGPRHEPWSSWRVTSWRSCFLLRSASFAMWMGKWGSASLTFTKYSWFVKFCISLAAFLQLNLKNSGRAVLRRLIQQIEGWKGILYLEGGRQHVCCSWLSRIVCSRKYMWSQNYTLSWFTHLWFKCRMQPVIELSDSMKHWWYFYDTGDYEIQPLKKRVVYSYSEAYGQGGQIG